jgi:hypothetical protein
MRDFCHRVHSGGIYEQSTHIIAVVKAALNALGVEVGAPLPPIQPLKGAELAYVQRVARSLARLEESLPVGQ